MNAVMPLYKPAGLTPLQALDRLRLVHPEYQNKTLSYAGRLDPMAEGVLLILVGEENKQREQYLNLDKVYEFRALLGLETDTYDTLGLVELKALAQPLPDIKIQIEHIILDLIGTRIQAYPAYSSKTVKGKPLWWWAKNDRLTEITIPTKQVCIFSLHLIDIETIRIDNMITSIVQGIDNVHGSFRQDVIVKRWFEWSQHNANNKVIVLSFHASCSTGTYIRELVHEIGQMISIGAVTYTIKRTRIGEFGVEDCLKLNIAPPVST